MKHDQHQKYIDSLGKKFNNIHENLADIIKKLMKNNNCKEKVLAWMRQATFLNFDKTKTRSTKAMATDGFILNYINLLLILCKPFTKDFSKYP